MRVTTMRCRLAAMLVLGLVGAGGAGAVDVGRIKLATGAVTIQRDGVSIPAEVGARLREGDALRTGADGSVGITMNDDSLLSAGPNSVLSLDAFALDPATSKGRFDASLNRGSLSVISGRIAKQAPDAMTVRTPTMILGVRGTEFPVSYTHLTLPTNREV